MPHNVTATTLEFTFQNSGPCDRETKLLAALMLLPGSRPWMICGYSDYVRAAERLTILEAMMTQTREQMTEAKVNLLASIKKDWATNEIPAETLAALHASE